MATIAIGTIDAIGQASPVAIAVLAAAATIVFGILPGPLLDLASDAGAALL